MDGGGGVNWFGRASGETYFCCRVDGEDIVASGLCSMSIGFSRGFSYM